MTSTSRVFQLLLLFSFFFFNDTATTEIYTLSLHDALPIYFKVYGRVTDVADPAVRRRYADVLEAKIGWRPADPYHLFSVDIGEAAYVVFGRERFAMRWNPAEGFRRWALQAG